MNKSCNNVKAFSNSFGMEHNNRIRLNLSRVYDSIKNKIEHYKPREPQGSVPTWLQVKIVLETMKKEL